jgi:hypothetical protein
VNVADALLEQADARLDQALPLLRRVILRVLAQIAELARASDLLRQLAFELPVELRDLVLELLEQPRLQSILPRENGMRSPVPAS